MWLKDVMNESRDAVDYVAGVVFGGVELGDMCGEVADV